ncbi:hypothetical protein ZWY2020_034782 [Hordeum vulgare]|nr:hypothetical protein ZWY2020_034782 [Hordeum vulgare]
MCGGAILANLTPDRVRRRLTAAQLWPDAYFPAERAASGRRRRRRRAAATTDDDFEAEFQVFEEEEDDSDDDYEAPPAAASPAVALGSSRRRVAGAKSTNYIRVRHRTSGRRAAEDTRQRRRVWLGTYGGDAEEAAPAYDREARRVRGKSARLDDSPNEGCPRRRNLPGTIDLNQPPAVSGDHMVSADADACKAKIMQLVAEGPRDGRMAGLASELMDGARHGSETRVSVVMRCAALISRCSREMEEVAALRRGLENRARRLDELKDQLVRIASLLGSEF